MVNDLDVTDGEIITAVVGGQWSLTVSQGVDANPSAHLIGAAAIVIPDGSTTAVATTQRISGLLPDVIYIAQAVVTTNQGNTYSLYSHIFGESVE